MNIKRQAIIDATVSLVADQGFEITSVADIANKSNVGNGTVYRNFKSKDNLIKEVYLILYTEMSTAWIKDYDEGKSIWERFQIIWNNVLDFYLNHPKKMIFLDQIENSPYFSKSIQVKDIEQSATFQRYYDEGLDKGEFRDMPIEIRHIFTIEAIHLIGKQILEGQLELTPELKKLGIMASWDALRK